ncbi:MAG: metallophosphoesterase [Thermomicrobiales bacterium]
MPGLNRVALGLGAAASLAGAVVSAHTARWRSPFQAQLEHLTLTIPDAGARPRPLRIGYVTDTHVGPFITPHRLAAAVDLLREERPDVLLLGGDYVSDSPRYFREAAAVLGAAAATVPHGALAVLGNHDYTNGAARARSELERRGIRVLVNESESVDIAGHVIWIVGVDDAALGRPHLDAAFSNVPVRSSVVSLWHEPDWAELAAARGASLQLSGHSHGGQVRLPVFGGFAAPTGGRRFVIGLNQVEGMPVYTSRGFGVFRPPIRYRCLPEITLVTLS